MRWTQTLIPSLRNVPKDAEALSHQLALRGRADPPARVGCLQLFALGFRVLHKVIGIIREEMNKAGAPKSCYPPFIRPRFGKSRAATKRWGKTRSL